MKKKKIINDAMGFTKTGIILGVGADAVTKAGGNAAGINALGSYMPAMGSIMGGGHTLNMLGDLIPKKKKK